jgi:hypothetical protein
MQQKSPIGLDQLCGAVHGLLLEYGVWPTSGAKQFRADH